MVSMRHVLCGLLLAAGCAGGGGNQAAPDAPAADDGKSLLTMPADPSSLSAVVTQEIHHVVAAQVSDATDPAVGAINDVYGAPTWVVPGDMAVATLLLWKAGYNAEARAACDYLARTQAVDGSWANQYDGVQLSSSSNGSFTRMTAEAAIALAVVDATKYQANLDRAVAWLASMMDPSVKGGADDGLLGGGFDATGAVIGDRWASDNSYAAVLFDLVGRTDLRDRVIGGIDHVLLQSDQWLRSVASDGTPETAAFDWVSFAPAQLGLARLGATYPANLDTTIREQLQVTTGADAGAVHEAQGSTLLMPGTGFQASMVWLADDAADATSNRTWAEATSGLWQTTPDVNADTGGWVDWRNTADDSTAPNWQRFIDTSSYYVFVVESWHY